MDLLSVKGNQIVDAHGQEVRLRGTCVGGWMNMEDFINAYPGAEHQLRAVMARELGAGKAQFFFESLLDHFFTEDDVAYIKSLGASVVRLPLNYRHFEHDDHPFEYLEAGFTRLNQAVDWCAQHDLYVILDLHACPGWQNTDWHSDNASRHSLFWEHAHFQERFVQLWQEFARRYRGNPTIAGYNLMNEPVTNTPFGRFSSTYHPNWKVINRVYRRTVAAIRAIDPDHIIFLEGDYYSSRFAGFDAPFAPNLVYSSHNYNQAGFGPGPYPGVILGQQWDITRQRQVFAEHEGIRFCREHNVPLWVGEFGAAYNGPAVEIPDRLRAMNDQLTVYNENAIHWTTWTYKDTDVMGWVQLDPTCAYLNAIRPVYQAKADLSVDFWMKWLPPTPVEQKSIELARQVEEYIDDPSLDSKANQTYLGQHLLSGYVAALMQPAYVHCFSGLSEERLDDLLASFELRNCRPHAGLVEILKKQLTA
jgi:aryl-phospho-beta-D-glucosidase BglC (GH1 family)